MKLLPGLALLALAATAAPAAAEPAERTVSRFLDAVAAHDRPAVAALLADDVVAEYPFDVSGQTAPGSWRRFAGREAVLINYVDRAFARITRFAWRDREVTVSGDGRRVFLEAWGDMTLADGTAYANRYVLRFDVRDSRIAHLKEYLNPVTSAIATGSRTGADPAPR